MFFFFFVLCSFNKNWLLTNDHWPLGTESFHSKEFELINLFIFERETYFFVHRLLELNVLIVSCHSMDKKEVSESFANKSSSFSSCFMYFNLIGKEPCLLLWFFLCSSLSWNMKKERFWSGHLGLYHVHRLTTIIWSNWLLFIYHWLNRKILIHNGFENNVFFCFVWSGIPTEYVSSKFEQYFDVLALSPFEKFFSV